MRFTYILVIVLTIIYTGIFPVFADEIEWVDPQEKTLRLTESFSREGFLIEASDFFENTALITVYDTNRRLVTRNITRINDSLNINDRLNITIIDLQERTGNITANQGLNVVVDQWVKVNTRVAGRPALKVSIIPYEKQINNRTIVNRVFTPGSEISINISIRNEGKAVLKTPTLKINSTLPLLSGEKLNYELPDLKAGNVSDTITVRFKAPFTEERKSFTISAEAKGNDIFGRAYQVADSNYIEVRPQIEKMIELKKYVSEKVYIGDIAVVSIGIRNNGSQTIDNVNLTESLPSGLKPLDTNLSWSFTLRPYEQKSITYKIKPQKPGTYFLPPGSSRIEYQGGLEYNTQLNKLIVNGPYVVLMKSATSVNPVKGENINITVEAKNIGDATAAVKLNDSIPEDYSLSNKSFKTVLNTMVLRPGNSISFSYVLNTTDAGSYTLPSAEAVVLDQFLRQDRDERYVQRITSNDLIINVREPIKLESPSVEMVSTPVQTVIPESTQMPVFTEIPASASTPKQAAGFQAYIFFIIFFIVTWIIKKGF